MIVVGIYEAIIYSSTQKYEYLKRKYMQSKMCMSLSTIKRAQAEYAHYATSGKRVVKQSNNANI